MVHLYYGIGDSRFGWGKNEIEDKACGIDDRYDSYNVPSAAKDSVYFSIEGRKI